MNLINIEPWQEEALKEIAITGYNTLGVDISDALASDLAKESLTSPQLMQAICLNLALILNLDENEHVNQINDRSKLEEAYKICVTYDRVHRIGSNGEFSHVEQAGNLITGFVGNTVKVKKKP